MKKKKHSCTILQAPHESANPVGHKEVNPARYSCGQIAAVLFPGALVSLQISVVS